MFDLKLAQDNIEVSNMINISNNDGYDNQPFFENDTIIYYSSNRNGQTDILKYNRFNDSKQFINNSDGSEYSPQKFQNATNYLPFALTQMEHKIFIRLI
jgi:Tol biopolymer transport system component